MKKLLVLLLTAACALCLAFAFAGCTDENGESLWGGTNTQQGETGGSDTDDSGSSDSGSDNTGDTGDGSDNTDDSGNTGDTGGSDNTGDTGGSEETGGGQHNHTYYYLCSQTEHYQKCIFCGKENNRAAHNVTEGICPICGYVEKCTEGLHFIEDMGYIGNPFRNLKHSRCYYVEKGNAKDSHIYIPSFYNGLPVRYIKGGSYAFQNCTNLESITIGNGVTSIGSYAFQNCTNLKSIIIPEGVGLIDAGAFDGCTNLTNITLPGDISIACDAFTNTGIYDNPNNWVNDILYVDNCCIKAKKTLSGNREIKQGTKLIAVGAFDECTNLKSITIPDSVTSIGEGAFYNCDNLESITIPDSVTSIGGYAFAGCTSLENVNILDSVISIGERVFYDTAYYNNPGNWSNGVLYLSNYLIEAKDSLSDNYEINKGTQLIAAYAFNDCKNLKSITIPDSVTSIGEWAFEGCDNLESITIPDSVTSIGGYAFAGCTNLTSVTIGNSVTSIGWDAFLNCNNLESVYITDIAAWCNIDFSNNIANPISGAKAKNVYVNGQLLTDLVIPQGVHVINNFSFCGSDFNSITIPNSVTSISEGAFYYCSLTSITIPNSIISIGEGAFWDCTNLASITIPNSVTSIGSEAFRGCTNLTSITIPNSVTSIGSWTFEDCTNLESVTMGNGVTSIGRSAFYNCKNLKGVYITDIATWCNIDFHQNFDFHEDNYANPLYYAHYLYLDGQLVTNLEIPQGITTIKSFTFEDYTNLIKITIPSSVTSIDDNAFYGCYKLDEVINLSGLPIEKGQDTYGGVAEYAINVVNSPEQSKIKYLQEYIFYEDGNDVYMLNYTGNNTELQLPDKFNNKSYGIYNYALYHKNNKLSTVYIPDGVTSIGKYAFRDCTAEIIWGDNPSIKEISCFGGYKGTSITIPDSVTSIGEYAFSDCTAEIIWEDNPTIKEIGHDAFYGYKGTSITIPDSVTSIGSSAFSVCSSLESVTIGNSVTSIGEEAFEWCTSLTSITIPDSVTSIGNSAFYKCTSLKGVYITDIAAWCNIDFDGSSANPLYYAHNLYLDSQLVTELTAEMLQGVTKIKDYAFNGCTSLTSITIPDYVTSIGYDAFSGCKNLESVSIGNGVTSIGSWAFNGCTSLESITIPDGVTSIGSWAFNGCTSLTSVTIGNGVTSIDSGAFSGCTSLESVTFNNPNGWYYTSSSSATSGTDIKSEDLQKPETAATYLKSTYKNYYWKRKTT